MSGQRVGTSIGDLHVDDDGAGPPAVLWHSLFVDATSFELLRPSLARHRRLIVIDGPGHGRSGPPTGLFTIDDCARAAAAILDDLGIAGPVDWVGNAWGGHVGLALAADAPRRIRSLVTIGTPIQGFSRLQRLRDLYPLLALYRVAGPVGVITQALTDVLIGADAVAAHPDLAARVIAAFGTADRRAMFTAMRSAMLRRKTFARLDAIRAPVLMIAAHDDPAWTPAMAEAAVARTPRGMALSARGQGHVAPLLSEAALLGGIIPSFWAAPADHVRSHIMGPAAS